MKLRSTIVTLAACAAAAFGTPAAQSHPVLADGASTGVASATSQTTLAAMLKAGVNFHARGARAQVTGIRPDDRAGRRGV